MKRSQNKFWNYIKTFMWTRIQNQIQNFLSETGPKPTKSVPSRNQIRNQNPYLELNLVHYHSDPEHFNSQPKGSSVTSDGKYMDLQPMDIIQPRWNPGNNIKLQFNFIFYRERCFIFNSGQGKCGENKFLLLVIEGISNLD